MPEKKYSKEYKNLINRQEKVYEFLKRGDHRGYGSFSKKINGLGVLNIIPESKVKEVLGYIIKKTGISEEHIEVRHCRHGKISDDTIKLSAEVYYSPILVFVSKEKAIQYVKEFVL